MQPKRAKEQMAGVNVLINQLNCQDVQKRVQAASKVHIIGKAIGLERVNKELIPFLRENVVVDETSVVISLLGNIVQLGQKIGTGSTAYLSLLPLMEDLAQSQDNNIRAQTIQKYLLIVSKCDMNKHQSQIINSLNNIYQMEFEGAKELVIAVIAHKLGNFNPKNQKQLLQYYLKMAESQSLTCKKFAVQYSSLLLKWINSNEQLILKIIDLLFKDKQQAYKNYLIDTIIELCRLRPLTNLQSYFNLVSYQYTWRVRYELISKADVFAQFMSKENFKAFLNIYVKYFNDIQPQIRSITCLKIQDIAQYISSQDIISKIIPALQNITQDSHSFVRNSLSNSLLSLCAIIGMKNTSELILPKFLQLLKDEDQSVRLAAFAKVNCLCDVLGVQTLSQTTLPILYDMAMHPNWRIRAESIQIFAYFVCKSNQDFLNEKNMLVALNYIRDRAFAVRKQGINLLLKALQQHGQIWFQKAVMPKLLQIFKATSYLLRQAILLTINSLIPLLSVDYLQKNVLSLVLSSATDPVQGVRMTACNTINILYGFLPKDKQNIKKVMKILKNDKQKDVKYLANKYFSDYV